MNELNSIAFSRAAVVPFEAPPKQSAEVAAQVPGETQQGLGEQLDRRVKAFANRATALQGPGGGDATLRRLVMQELQKFHDFEYDVGLRDVGQRPAPAEHPVALEVVEADIPVLTALSSKLDGQLGLMRLQALNESGNEVAASGDFFDSLRELIEMIGGDYLAVYERLIEQYSAMFKDFNEQIMSKMSGWITSHNDGKEIEFDGAAFRSAIVEMLVKYSTFPDSLLFPDPNSGTSATREEALAWAEAMGLPSSCVKTNPQGGYCVTMDLSPLATMHDSMPASTVRWDSAKFQAWQTGFNTQEAEMKNYLQVATGKYSNANAYHDNFIKILSSQLSQFAEMLKAYLT